MSTTTRTLRRYDHRLKELVRSTGNVHVALECGVPRSTAYDWLTGPHTEVVSIEVCDKHVAELEREVVLLRRQNVRLVALLRLVLTVTKVMSFSMAYVRQTPDEMYFGTGEQIPKQLRIARLAARQSRLKANRALSCSKCETSVSISSQRS